MSVTNSVAGKSADALLAEWHDYWLAQNEPGLVAFVDNVQKEMNRLRLWLSEIERLHLGDQPTALNMPEIDYAKRHIGTMRRLAREALAGKEYPYDA